MIFKKGLVFIFIFSLLFVLSTQAAEPPELLGAEKVMAQIEEMIKTAPRESPGESIGQRLLSVLSWLFKPARVNLIRPTEDPRNNRFQQWIQDLTEFSDQQKNLSPEFAAQEWLKLFDRFIALSSNLNTEDRTDFDFERDIQSSLYLSGHPLVEALPGPDSWIYLADLVAKRKPAEKGKEKPEIGLRLLTLVLTKQTAQLQNELDTLMNRPDVTSASEKAWMKRQVFLMQEIYNQPSEKMTPAELVTHFEKVLELKKTGEGVSMGILKVPDLVTLIGREKAAKLLTKALFIPNLNLKIVEGEATLDLARTLFKENISRLSTPQWGLVQSIQTTDLYESMQDTFSQTVLMHIKKKQSVSWEIDQLRKDAAAYYLIGLVYKGKLDKAIGIALAVKEEERENNRLVEIWKTINWVSQGPVFLEFFHQALRKEPRLPFWGLYLEVAQSLGQIQKPLNLLQDTIENKKLEPTLRFFYQNQLVKIHLMMDQVEKAVPLMQEMLQAKMKNDKTEAKLFEMKLQIAENLAKLGVLLDRREWVREAVTAVLEIDRKSSEDPWSHSPSFIRFLSKQGMYAEAQTIVLAQIEAIVKNTSAESDGANSDIQLFQIQFHLGFLAEIYNQAGRFQDTLLLLEKAPWWNADDILSLDDDMVQLKAAEALHAVGRNPEALQILKYYLYRNPNDDAAYQLLLAVTGPEILPWLDELYARDLFEERPLLWKAWLLKKMNRLDEAESTVRKALQVDPTDGEQPKGDRVRGYEILSEILDAKGKTKDAAFFRDVVKSVRLAEEGDDFAEAGLLQRSLDFYLKAQALFAEAYCIQWRLAERLYAAGDLGGAKKHYRIAFERMPEQFGRVASFCFGCENAFGRPQSRSMAEEVLLRLSREHAPRPQVFYLLGELRKNQNKYRESYEYYKKAVILDPNYLDAWENIQDLFENLFLSQSEQDKVHLRMLQLDPLQKHYYSGSRTRIGDLKKFWQIMAANQKFNLPVPKALLQLTAAKRIIAEQKAQAKQYVEHLYRTRDSAPKPGEALARLKSIQRISDFFSFDQQKNLE